MKDIVSFYELSRYKKDSLPCWVAVVTLKKILKGDNINLESIA